jgi:transposase
MVGCRKARAYNIKLYRKIRNTVEILGWLKSFRRITIRYERLASTTYKALVVTIIASIIIHLRYGIFEMSSL